MQENKKTKTAKSPYPYMLDALGDVYAFGQEKYEGRTLYERIEDFNDSIEDAIQDRLNACQRHLAKGYRKADDESGLPHIYHAFFNLGMVIELMEYYDYGQEDGE